MSSEELVFLLLLIGLSGGARLLCAFADCDSDPWFGAQDDDPPKNSDPWQRELHTLNLPRRHPYC